MNINYEDIIAKANARKDALKALEVELTFVSDVAEQLAVSMNYFINLRAMLIALDAEGQSMVRPLCAPAIEVGLMLGDIQARINARTVLLVGFTQ